MGVRCAAQFDKTSHESKIRFYPSTTIVNYASNRHWKNEKDLN